MAFHYDWFKGHIPLWEKILKRYQNKPNLLFLEVGCYEGRATLWLCQNILTNPSSKIFVIDTFEGSMEHSKEDSKNLFNDFKENLSPYISKVIINKGLSGEVLKRLDSKTKFDFIYVDGSQTARHVLEDTILGWALLEKGGIMILNDYGWRLYENPILCPYPAIEAFLKIFEGQYEVLHVGYQVVIIKKGDNLSIPKTIKGSKKYYPLQDDRSEAEKALKKIQSSKVYKIWQRYCRVRDSIKNKILQ